MNRTRKPTFLGQEADPLVDLDTIQPIPNALQTAASNLNEIGNQTGFNVRHSGEGGQVEPPQTYFDARSLRKSARTAQLNIAIKPKTKERFWTFAVEQGVTVGEDALLLLLDKAGA